MTVLDKLTTKECDKVFPTWEPKHQNAFNAIKVLAMSKKCLTTIDPSLMLLGHKIFLTSISKIRKILIALIAT